MYQLFDEFFTVCVSVLARNEVGQLFHARNLDFGLFLRSVRCSPTKRYHEL